MKTCEHCQEAFVPRRSDQRFHSAKCRLAHFRAGKAVSEPDLPVSEPFEPVSGAEGGDRDRAALEAQLHWYLDQAEKRPDPWWWSW